MSKVIALSGWKESGKDTVAAYLVREYGYTRLSFADALKELVAQQYDIPLEYMHDPTRKEMPLPKYPVIPGDPFSEKIQEMLRTELSSGFWTPRALCILEGSIKRSVHTNYWVRAILSQILDFPELNYVISDMRYLSEVDTLKLFLPRADMVRVNRWSSITTMDPSERNLDEYKFDYELDNKGTVEDLHRNIDTLITSLAGRS